MNPFSIILLLVARKLVVFSRVMTRVQPASSLLLQVLELDVMDIRIVEERNYTNSEDMSSSTPDELHIQKKHFLFFTDEKIFSVLMEICRTLGTDAVFYIAIYLHNNSFS